MKGAGVIGWVALGSSAGLGVSCAAFTFGYLLGRGEWLGAGIVACVAAWVVLVIADSIRAKQEGP